MSSVLKALRQQQSELIPPQQPIELSAATPTEQRASRWWWLIVVVAVLAGWGATYWYFSGLGSTNLPTAEQSEAGNSEQAQEPTLTLGTPPKVRRVELPQQQTVDKVATEQPIRSNFQAVPAQAPDEAVDLNEVPADLLAAFEEAIAATEQGTTRTTTQSVLPSIYELDRNLQQRIPSFTYDGHQYSSRTAERFVEFAGQRLRQGDYWQGIQVLTIAPNHVVLALGNEAFQQPALEDWTTRP